MPDEHPLMARSQTCLRARRRRSSRSGFIGAFISGQVAWRPGGEPAPEGLAEQAQLVVKNARAALNAAGASSEDLVMIRAYMVDLTPGRLEDVWPHVHALFDGARPSVTGIGVAALAAPELQLEIEMIVRLPG